MICEFTGTVIPCKCRSITTISFMDQQTSVPCQYPIIEKPRAWTPPKNSRVRKMP